MRATHSKPFPGAWRTQFMALVLKVNPEAAHESFNDPLGCTNPPPVSTSCTSQCTPANRENLVQENVTHVHSHSPLWLLRHLLITLIKNNKENPLQPQQHVQCYNVSAEHKKEDRAKVLCLNFRVRAVMVLMIKGRPYLHISCYILCSAVWAFGTAINGTTVWEKYNNITMISLKYFFHYVFGIIFLQP